MVGAITYGRETIRYEIRYLATRRTLGIEVHPDCRVLVRAPIDCSPLIIAEKVQKRAAWISRQRREFERYHPRTPERQYLSGECHLYLGRQYRLKVLLRDVASVKLERNRLLVNVPNVSARGRVKTLLHRWYLDRARVVFSEVLNERLLQFRGVDRPRLVVRAMQSRWGSLSRAGTMTLNVNLVRAPHSCIEYVVTHELCHLAHRDHGTRFFRLLGRLMPDWEHRKQRLEEALL
ncbi:MAG: M48 family metallopeptidase [Gammaproteobacteria bacterium]|nr:M48 family metallopeptidase [Gammaproteobacteria bacterium]